jgi:hypothetical protein
MTPAELKKQQDSLLQDYTKKIDSLKDYKKNMLSTIEKMKSDLDKMKSDLDKMKL